MSSTTLLPEDARDIARALRLYAHATIAANAHIAETIPPTPDGTEKRRAADLVELAQEFDVAQKIVLNPEEDSPE